MKNFLITCLVILSLQPLSGQAYYRITGRVLNQSNLVPLVGAHVQLAQPTSGIVKNTTTSPVGRFEFKELTPGDYTVKIAHVGYQEYERNVTLISDHLNLKTIRLVYAPIPLGQVNVEEVRPLAIQKGDTTQYSAEVFKTNPDASAEDLVRKMPGITINDGQVQAQGENIKKVLVDNRPFFGDDPNIALRNLPAEIIDKIQVFDQQSEQAQMTGFDDGNTVKTMNIITKAGMNTGQFGKLYAGYGEEGKYRLGGSVNIFNGQQRISIIGQSNNVNIQNFATEDLLGVVSSTGRRRGGHFGGMGGGRGHSGHRPGSYRSARGGSISDFLVPQQGGISTTHAIGLNYQDKWWQKLDITGSYFFNWSDNDNEWELLRNYFSSSDLSDSYQEDETVNSQNLNHRLNLRLDYNLTENDRLTFRPRLTIQQNDGSSDLSAESYYGSDLTSALLNIFNSDLATANFSSRQYYRHQFSKKGRTLSLGSTITINYYTGDSDQEAVSTVFSSDSLLNGTGRQQSELTQDGLELSGNLSFTEPFGANGSVTASYEISNQANSSDKTTYLQAGTDGAYTLLDSSQSNLFTNDYRSQETSIGYRYRKDGTMLILRGNYQYATLRNDQEFPFSARTDKTYKSFLPLWIMRYKIDEFRRLSLVYRQSLQLPSVNQLQAVVDNSNPLQISVGNPNLKQQFNHRLFLRYSATRHDRESVFFAMLAFDYATDYIGSRTIASGDSTVYEGIPLTRGSQLVIPENMDGYRNLRSFMTYGHPLPWLKSNLNLNLSANYTCTPGYLGDQENYSDSRNYGLQIILASNVSERLDFTISSNSNWFRIENSLGNDDSRYFTQSSSCKLDWIIGPGITLHSSLDYRSYTGFSFAGKNTITLLNLGVGKKFFAGQKGELQFAVFDVLGENSNLSQSNTGTYIEENQSLALTRYYLLSFTYRIKNFQL